MSLGIIQQHAYDESAKFWHAKRVRGFSYPSTTVLFTYCFVPLVNFN